MAAPALPNAVLRGVAALADHAREGQAVPASHPRREHAHPSRDRGRQSDPRSANRRALRTLSNESINKTLRTLASVLDEAEDVGFVARNVARGRRTREPLERRRPRGIIEVEEFLSLLDAAIQLDRERHRPGTLARAAEVRTLRDEANLEWAVIAKQLGLARSTAFYLYACRDERTGPIWGARRPVIATLALAGPRVTELCQLNVDDLDLAKARFYVNDAKTAAGIRAVDIHPRLLEELAPTPRTGRRHRVIAGLPHAHGQPSQQGQRPAPRDRARRLPSERDQSHEGPAADPRPRHSTHVPAHLHHVHDRRRV